MHDEFDLDDLDDMEEPIDFNEVMDAFLDDEVTFPPRFLYRLSGLEELELEQFIETWPQGSPIRRERLLEDLEALTEDAYHLDFDQIFRLGLKETSAHTRQVAIRALWECPEPDLIPELSALLIDDPEADVRAQAARGLGRFIYLAETDEIDPSHGIRLVSQLTGLYNSDIPDVVRLGILEALGFSDSNQVNKLIENAFEQDREDWIVSALIATGRSANEQWIPQVIENLNHDSDAIRLEAVQASGLLGAQQAATHLLHLIDDPEEEIKFAAIWALSEIGGLDARAALEALAKNAEDEDEIELISEALENLNFTEMAIDFDLFDLSEDDLSDMLDNDDE
jgi:HEAT repeat protein